MSTVRAWPKGSPIPQTIGVAGGLLCALLAGLLIPTYGVQALIMLLGAVVVLVILRWPFLGLLIFAATIAVENILVVEGAGAAVTGSRLLGMLVFAAWFLGKLVRRESIVPLLTSMVALASALLFSFALVSVLWASFPQVARSASIQLAQLIALAFITFDMARSWERLDMLVKALMVGATLAALLTVHQALFTGVRRAGDNISGGINQTATLLVTMLPVAFYLLRSRTTAAWRLLGVSYIAVGTTAIILTYSRMNLLVLPVILALLTFHALLGRRGRVPILVTALIAIGIGLHTIPVDRLQTRLDTIMPYIEGTVGSDDSGILEPSARGYHLRLGLAIARDKPVIGGGFRNYGHLFRAEYQYVVPGAGRIFYSVRSPHSSHVGMLADLGTIGFGLWLIVLFAAGLVPAIRTWRRSARAPDSAPFLISQALAYALGLQIFVYGWYSTIDRDKLLWMLLGLAAATWTLARSGTSSAAASPRVDRTGQQAMGRSQSRPAEWTS
jgi:O-antigen ligase